MQAIKLPALSITNKISNMKKILAIVAILFSVLSANAQVYVGGAIGYGSDKETSASPSTDTFRFAPEIGYKFDENWDGGLSFDYTSVSKSGTTLSGFGVGGYVRYNYFKTGIATLFVEGGAGITSYNKDRGSSYYLALSPGLSIDLSEKVFLVAKTGLLGYSKNLALVLTTTTSA